MRPAERVKVLVDAFNEGNIERVIDGLAPDVEIVIPIYRLGEMAGPPALNGKDDIRRRLVHRYESGGRIELMSISDDGTGAVATIKSSHQGELAVTFKFDDQGLARRLIVFKQ